MNELFQQAKTFASKKKFKKALLIIKRINQQNFDVLELEAACLFHEKKYKMACLKLEKALELAESQKQKLDTLQNLAAANELLGYTSKAIDYLQLALEIDGSLSTADKRYILIKLAFAENKHALVEQYAPLLTNTSEYLAESLLLLGLVAIEVNNREYALTYFNRIVAELRIEGRVSVNTATLKKLLDGFHKISEFQRGRELLDILATKYGHEQWYKTCKVKFIESQIIISNDVYVSEIVNEKRLVDNHELTESHTINSQDPIIHVAISQLLNALRAMGAFFHPNLSILEKSGEITIHCLNDSEKHELLMDIPIQCMPLLRDFKLTIGEKGKLKAQPIKSMLNPEAKNIMILLVNLYNCCNKLNTWKASFPLFALAGHHDIFNKLISARSNFAAYSVFYAARKCEINDDILIKSFVGSRVFSFEQSDLRKIGAKTKNAVEAGFLPIIDLINHRMGEHKFITDRKTQRIQTFSKPGLSGREIFVQYNLDDPLITLLAYGFVDESCSWIYSIPLTVTTTSKLKIEICNFVSAAEIKNIPEHLRGFPEYYPAGISRKSNVVTVDKLIIPSVKNMHIFKEIMSCILKSIDLENFYDDVDYLGRELIFIEKQIMQLNICYWQELKTMINANINSEFPINTSVAKQINQLADFCLLHIKTFQSQRAHVLFK